ncbi:MAG: hypothetical protein KJ792_16380 [Actinobacteria bacterium]|nr:hypothetical protein [Actinomycetota bacterium]
MNEGSSDVRFMVDHMVIRLGKYLRILGMVQIKVTVLAPTQAPYAMPNLSKFNPFPSLFPFKTQLF